MATQLYQLYATSSANLYNEYTTSFVSTLDKIPDLLMDSEFLELYDWYCGKGVEKYSLRNPDEQGNIELVIMMVDEYDIEVLTFCLVPVRSFI